MNPSDFYVRLMAYVDDIDPGYNLPKIRAIPVDKLETLARELAAASTKDLPRDVRRFQSLNPDGRAVIKDSPTSTLAALTSHELVK